MKNSSAPLPILALFFGMSHVTNSLAESLPSIDRIEHRIYAETEMVRIETLWWMSIGYTGEMPITLDSKGLFSDIIPASIEMRLEEELIPSSVLVTESGIRVNARLPERIIEEFSLKISFTVRRTSKAGFRDFSPSDFFRISEMRNWKSDEGATASYGKFNTVSGVVYHREPEFILSSNLVSSDAIGDGMVRTNLAAVSTAGFYVGLADRAHYDDFNQEEKGTVFTIARRKTSIIPKHFWEAAITEAWPRFLDHVFIREGVARPRQVTLVELDAPLGGGPLGSGVVGIYLGDRIPSLAQEHIFRSTGFIPRATGIEYVESEYSNFKDPLYTYVLDMVTHELGHIFFGFGETSTLVTFDHELWFAYGIGLLYDRMVFASLSNEVSPLFKGLHARWEKVYAPQVLIDQRLINPDTSEDERLGVPRVQVFGHAKALAYLSELRLRVGTDRFDGAIKDLMTSPERQLNYESFIRALPKETVLAVEKEFGVR